MAMQETPKGVLLSSDDRDRMTKLGEETLRLVKEMDLIIARTLGVEPSKSPESATFILRAPSPPEGEGGVVPFAGYPQHPLAIQLGEYCYDWIQMMCYAGPCQLMSE